MMVLDAALHEKPRVASTPKPVLEQEILICNIYDWHPKRSGNRCNVLFHSYQPICPLSAKINMRLSVSV
jgi:hypothetical protein